MIEKHVVCTAIHNKSVYTDSTINLIRKEHSTDS